MMHVAGKTSSQIRRIRRRKGYKKYASVYLLLVAPVALVLIFQYVPLVGIQMAFRDFKIRSGFAGFFTSPWVGLKHFRAVFASGAFYTALGNTLKLTTIKLVTVFPAPIIFAILLNEVRFMRYKRVVQTVSTLPNFFSSVTIFGIVQMLLSPQYGLMNMLLESLGMNTVYFLGQPSVIRPLAVAWDVWAGTGWGAIVYLAAIAGIDTELYEAAAIDGASRFQCILRITLPSLTPAILLMFVFRLAGLLSAGTEQMLLLYSPAVHSTADTLDIFVLRNGVQNTATMSFASAVGLFTSSIATVLVLAANQISRKLGYVAIFD